MTEKEEIQRNIEWAKKMREQLLKEGKNWK